MIDQDSLFSERSGLRCAVISGYRLGIPDIPLAAINPLLAREMLKCAVERFLVEIAADVGLAYVVEQD